MNARAECDTANAVTSLDGNGFETCWSLDQLVMTCSQFSRVTN